MPIYNHQSGERARRVEKEHIDIISYKNISDVQNCSNGSQIKLMSDMMNVRERVIETQLRDVVKICVQYSFTL